MKSVAVFCGSSPGFNPAYTVAAQRLGRLVAERRLTLVYGGGRVGLMGVVADAALAAGGEVIGIIPAALADKEVGHTGLTRLEIVASMHERKARMADLSDGFIALPGGIGTFEEIFEVWTWAQLGYHAKPLGFLDVADYYTRLASFIEHSVQEGFVRPAHRDMVKIATGAAELLDHFASYVPAAQPKWVERGQT
jgi:uncharacterized protein (TIGR00730 family)